MPALFLPFLFAGLLALTGCVNTTPVLDSHFGEAVNTAKAQQTINPDAAKNKQAAGMDGQTAKSALDRYQQSFESPPVSPNVFNIGVGADSSSNGSP